MDDKKTVVPGVTPVAKKEFATLNDLAKVEQSVAQVIFGVNNKFTEITNQLQGFVLWTNKAVQKIERELRTLGVKLSVQDMATTSVVKILIEKGIMTEDEYKAVAQQLYAEAIEGEKKSED